MSRLVPVLLLLQGVGAFNTTDYVGFVSGPNCGRGTMDIIWQCFTTIFLCVVTVLHLDIPPFPLSKWEGYLCKLIWLGIGLVAPEMICFKAVCDRVAASQLVKVFRDKYSIKLSLKQAHFILAGGIVMELEDHSTIHPRLLFLNGDESSAQSLACAELIPENLPTDQSIEDRSKADVLAKALAAAQAFWTAVMIIGRLAGHKDVSLLEVEAVGYICLALVAYACWWSKPYDISTNGRIPVPSGFEGLWENYIRAKASKKMMYTISFEFIGLTIYHGNSSYPLVLTVFPILGAIYGAIHCAAWNYGFPSLPEEICWRVAAILITISPATLVVGAAFGQNLHLYQTINSYGVTLLYMIARIYIVIEVFIAFRSAPPSIYANFSWTSYFGHVGS